jgi:hypothetical protein
METNEIELAWGTQGQGLWERGLPIKSVGIRNNTN